MSAIDVAHWQLLRLQLSNLPPPGKSHVEAYEVLYLARPELAQLPS